jgi:hypothetical protein
MLGGVSGGEVDELGQNHLSNLGACVGHRHTVGAVGRRLMIPATPLPKRCPTVGHKLEVLLAWQSAYAVTQAYHGSIGFRCHAR